MRAVDARPALLLLELHAYAMDFDLPKNVEGKQQRNDEREQRARRSKRQRQDYECDRVAHTKTCTTETNASRLAQAQYDALGGTNRAAHS